MKPTPSDRNPIRQRRDDAAAGRYSHAFLIAAAALALSGTHPVGAEMLPAGTSTGTLTLPDGRTSDVTYEITGEENGPQEITIVTAGASRYPLTDVQIGDDRISFKWEPGDRPVECTLERTSGRTYAGECPDPEGGPSVKLTLVPSAQE